MLSKMKIVGAMAAAAVLSACASGMEVEKAMGLTPKGGNFNKALYKEYVALAKDEASQADWRDADRYGMRAQETAKAKDLGPYDLKDFKLPADSLPDLKNARAQLLSYKSEGAAVLVPNATARAQAMFDCWVEQQEENHQPSHIARCRAAFEKAMGEIAAKMAQPMKKEVMKPKKKKKAKAKKPGKLTISNQYIVYFGFDSAKITKKEMKKVMDAAKFAMGYGPNKVRIDVVGHTDTTGSASYNQKLSDRRVDAVLGALLDLDVPAVMIKSAAKGETDPIDGSPDNVKSADNRRVTLRVRNR